MIVTLTGENTANRDAALRQLVADFRAAHGELAIQRLDGEDAEPAAISEALHSLPFLAARQLVVLRMPGANKSFSEQAETLLAGLPDTTDLIIIEPKPDKRSAYYKLLKQATDFRDHPVLDERGLARWLVGQADGGLSQTDALYLVGRVGLDQQMLASELEKLQLYQHTVSRQTIDLLTEPTPQSTIFELIEAACAGNARRALELYDEQRANKVEPPHIIAMLTWQLHVAALLAVAGTRSPESVAADAKLSPYVVKKTARLQSRLTRSRLTQLIGRLAELDYQSKQRPINIDQALKTYIIELATM